MKENQSPDNSTESVPHNWQRVFTSFFSGLQNGDYAHLINSASHPHILAIKRTDIVISRMRLLALLFAVMTPAWILIDYFIFPFYTWLSIAMLRTFTGVAFLALFLYHKDGKKRAHAHRSLFLLFLIPSVFYPISQYLLKEVDMSQNFAYLNSMGYTFLPFVVASCLAIFPLSVKENLAFSLLILSSQLLGFLFFPSSYASNGVGILWLWLLAILISIAATAGISQLAFMIVLVRQSIRDVITGCFTRSSGEELLAMQFSIAQRSKTALSLAYIDLDHFKTVNDQFGHEAGDLVLQRAANAIANELRDCDLLVRWGGEEFLIVMPNTSVAQAKTAMERICRSGLCKRPDGATMTASVGISEAWQDAAPNLDQLIDLADQRMYLAKQAGRNTIFCSGCKGSGITRQNTGGTADAKKQPASENSP